jgi:predicted amidophosphoribosyltransferase
MALMICPECNREISDKAELCPLCGFPIAKHLEEQKAELLKQEAIEAKRIKEEKLRAAYQEAQQINKAAAEATNSTVSKPNFKFIFGVIGFICILIICNYSE